MVKTAPVHWIADVKHTNDFAAYQEWDRYKAFVRIVRASCQCGQRRINDIVNQERLACGCYVTCNAVLIFSASLNAVGGR